MLSKLSEYTPTETESAIFPVNGLNDLLLPLIASWLRRRQVKP